MVKFARIPSYNQLFSGDPVWATLEVRRIGIDGRSMVTKNDYRFFHTLGEHGTSSGAKPYCSLFFKSAKNFKKYAAQISVEQARSSMRMMM